MDFYREIHHWEELGLIGYKAMHVYCLMRGEDQIIYPASWEATTMLMTMGLRTLHRIINLILKLMSEINIGRSPSNDGGAWDKLIRVQELAIAIQQRYVAAKDSNELVLETSKKAIPESIEKLFVHEKLMRNYLDMFELSTFSLKG